MSIIMTVYVLKSTVYFLVGQRGFIIISWKINSVDAELSPDENWKTYTELEPNSGGWSIYTPIKIAPLYVFYSHIYLSHFYFWLVVDDGWRISGDPELSCVK